MCPKDETVIMRLGELSAISKSISKWVNRKWPIKEQQQIHLAAKNPHNKINNLHAHHCDRTIKVMKQDKSSNCSTYRNVSNKMWCVANWNTLLCSNICHAIDIVKDVCVQLGYYGRIYGEIHQLLGWEKVWPQKNSLTTGTPSVPWTAASKHVGSQKWPIFLFFRGGRATVLWQHFKVGYTQFMHTLTTVKYWWISKLLHAAASATTTITITTTSDPTATTTNTTAVCVSLISSLNWT